MMQEKIPNAETGDIPPVDPFAKDKEAYPWLFEPIPLTMGENSYPNGMVAGWRDISSANFHEVHDNGEPLVNIADLHPPIFTSNDYGRKLENSAYGAPLQGTTIAQYVREDVARRLQEVQRSLPDGYRLVVFDAWRSLETQHATYQMCFDSIIEMMISQEILAPGEVLTPKAEELIGIEAQKFISLPSPMPERFHEDEAAVAAGRRIPSPHNTGGSVDLAFVKIDEEWLERLEELETLSSEINDPLSPQKAQYNFQISRIYRSHSQMPDFGTEWDYAGDRAALTYGEVEGASLLNDEARDSRRMLYNVMTRVGFEPYAEEWWHFNFGNQMAEMTKTYRDGTHSDAIYGNTNLTAEQQAVEKIHKELFAYLQAVAENPALADTIPEDLVALGATRERIQEITEFIGDPRRAPRFRHTNDMKYRGELPAGLVADVRHAQI